MTHQLIKYLFLILWLTPIFGAPCHPKINPKLPQYIIGYGSLINEASKKRTDPTAQENFPVIITGYERSWSVYGGPKTFLSVSEKQNATFNAVIYQLNQPKKVFLYDKREKSYCRKAVSQHQIQVYGTKLPDQKQIWIYSSSHPSHEYPTKDFPIFQSYLDIFISGCLQIEEKFNIKDFTKNCIKSTKHWPTAWESGVIFPRHPASYEPYATQVDHLLREVLEPQPPLRPLSN